jgi:membrane protease subunit HflK
MLIGISSDEAIQAELLAAFLIDQKAGNSLLYLPLDKLIQQSANASAAAAGAAAAPPATPAAPPEPPASLDGGAARSRETLRSRDRGDAR